MELCKDFLIPQYGGNCFSSVPGVLETLIVGETKRDVFLSEAMSHLPGGVDKVVFILFDAFGRKSFNSFSDNSLFLQTFLNQGFCIPTTSQFPSTTAAHVTTLLSGVPVYETGVCEWFYYEPKVEGVINPFKLNYYNESKLGTLIGGRELSEILPRKNYFADLKEKGVMSFRYAPDEIEPSIYGNYFGKDSEIIPYSKLSDGISRLIQNIKSYDGKQFHYLYIPDYDSICHKYGPETVEAKVCAEDILKELERLLLILGNKNVAITMTADHGQVTIDPLQTLYVNKLCPEIFEYLARTPSGNIIRFGGGYRNLLLYAQEGASTVLATILREKLRGAADVFTREEIAAFGILGPQPLSSHFSERIGDVIVIPYEGYSVNWKEEGLYIPEPYKGHHGGLSRSEMETVFSIVF